jgi:hypothetical protein
MLRLPFLLAARAPNLFVDEIGGGARSMRAGKGSRSIPLGRGRGLSLCGQVAFLLAARAPGIYLDVNLAAMLGQCVPRKAI